MLFRNLCAALLLSFATPAMADNVPITERGPKVGDSVPHDLSTIDAHGTPRNFDSLKGEKGLVLMMNRSLDWCPYCQRQAIDANKHTGAFKALGYPLVVLTYDSPETLKSFAQKHSLTYELISDKDSAVIDAFGLRNERYQEGHRAYGIPHPAIFVIDRQGVIRAKFMEEDYKDRPEIEDVLEAAAANR